MNRPVVNEEMNGVEIDQRTVDRREFMKKLAMGGATALAAGTVLAGPGKADARGRERGAFEQQAVLPGSPVAIGELKRLKVTCLSEVGWWSTPQLLAEVKAAGGMNSSQWGMSFTEKNAAGYSALVEAEGCDGKVHTVLLDTGWNVPYMNWVFQREGVAEKLKKGLVDRAILSHEHLDHFWGLPALCSLDGRIPLYVPSTLTSDARKFIEKSRHRGPVSQVAPGTIYKHFPGFATALMDVPIILGIRGEQVLFFNVKDKGLVIVTGCCHCGIKSSLDFARASIATATGKFHGIFGGLHVSALETWSPAADQQLDAMEQAKLTVVGSNHCTGIMAVQKMLERKLPVATGSANFGSKSNLYIGNGDSIVF
jgi:7,8-dihydropterin-6-yl-methyl-4-(beta-D-ribofuranosyl)aminobenzene 5'-phosphate synthase